MLTPETLAKFMAEIRAEVEAIVDRRLSNNALPIVIPDDSPLARLPNTEPLTKEQL